MPRSQILALFLFLTTPCLADGLKGIHFEALLATLLLSLFGGPIAGIIISKFKNGGATWKTAILAGIAGIFTCVLAILGLGVIWLNLKFTTFNHLHYPFSGGGLVGGILSYTLCSRAAKANPDTA